MPSVHCACDHFIYSELTERSFYAVSLKCYKSITAGKAFKKGSHGAELKLTPLSPEEMSASCIIGQISAFPVALFGDFLLIKKL